MLLRSLMTVSLLLMPTAGARSEPIAPREGDCVSGASREQQQECDRKISEQVGNASRVTPLGADWQMVRTKSPTRGPDAVAVLHVADSAKSDVSLAGLSLQCGQQGVEVVLVTLDRISRTDRPRVSLAAGTAAPTAFEASVVQAGEALLLPQNASKLAAGDWQKANELSVEIERKPAPLHGVIPIRGLAVALQTLIANCPAR